MISHRQQIPVTTGAGLSLADNMNQQDHIRPASEKHCQVTLAGTQKTPANCAASGMYYPGKYAD